MNKRLMSASTLALLSLFTFCVPAIAQDKAKKTKKTEYINAYDELTTANKYAAAGAISRSIPHYLRVLKADPINYSVAHYNLAEVYKAKGKCSSAGFHYQAYVLTGRDPATKKAALEGVRVCGGDKWPKLSIKVATAGAEVVINNTIFAQGKSIANLALPKNSYTVVVRATDHITKSDTVKLTGDKTLDVTLEKKAFYGKLGFDVFFKTKRFDGATITVTPKKIDKKSLKVEKIVIITPSKKMYKLPTGKYFIEVKAQGYDRWIRNVYVTRESTNKVGITLSQSLPEEIR